MVIPELKKIITNLNTVKYFSDGAASQYKNYKNLVNLCLMSRTSMSMQNGIFFATSHRKSPCDGIGGTVKHLVARASLQSTLEHHILTPQQMFEWCSQNIKGIQFYFVSTLDIDKHAETYKLEDRYLQSKTVCGTRSHHSFIPVSQYQLEMRRISEDLLFTLVNVRPCEEVLTLTHDYSTFQPGKYIACLYDGAWYVGYIRNRSEEHKDVEVEFMNRKGDAVSWPADTRRDVSWIPFQDILCTIEVPSLQGSSSRQYRLAQTDYLKIQTLLSSSSFV